LQLLVIQVLVAGPSSSQNMADYRVTLHVKNQPLTEVLSDIERQTDFVFAYNREVAKGKARITLDLTEDLRAVLKKITEQADYDFKRINNNIYVIPSQVSSSQVQLSEADEEVLAIRDHITIPGTVMDENGAG